MPCPSSIILEYYLQHMRIILEAAHWPWLRRDNPSTGVTLYQQYSRIIPALAAAGLSCVVLSDPLTPPIGGLCEDYPVLLKNQCRIIFSASIAANAGIYESLSTG